MARFVLALDQGTTSSRSVILNEKAELIGQSQKEFTQIYPKSGWVEHDPKEIWESQLETISQLLKGSNITSSDISAIGITNQRETTVVWNKVRGIPIYNAIVWQDRRTSDYCQELAPKGYAKSIQDKTGLVLDAYFSASKINWILENIPNAREQAEKGELAFGTVDSWLVWKLTNGKKHITDVSNASRTLLFNIHTLEWDQELLSLFEIPVHMLPQVVESSGELALTDKSIFGVEIPITGIIGDQQSALFGQMCIEPGLLKCTYGTGCFLMLNTGNEIVKSNHKMLSTIAWKIGNQTTYAVEGSVFIGGAVIQWLRDELGFFKEAADSEDLAEASEDNGGVYFVPALTGLGAPYWDANTRGSIFGISRGTNKSHLTRAALESIGFQVNDILNAMAEDVKFPIQNLRADGGAAANQLLLQFQSDISRICVQRPSSIESTAIGAAYLAGLGINLWTIDFLKANWKMHSEYTPQLDQEIADNLLDHWKEAITRTLGWNS